MYSIKCGDLGSDDCDYTATGETREEVIENLYAHAGEVHSEKLSSMTEEEKKAVDAKMNELLDAQEGGTSEESSPDEE